MPVIGFHASHEQIHPAILLDAVRAAEQVGFTAAMCSDHFSPWSQRQGHSGFAWSWLGAALQATSLPLGVVNAPGQRYHPAIIAQAIASLSAMFEGRFWVALGSGENANEHITGAGWPRKSVRNARLRECVEIIRALLAGEEVSHDGLVTVDRARIWTRPEIPPRLIATAVSVETAGWAGAWAEGLATITQPAEHLRQMIDAYRSAGGTGPLVCQVHLSYAETLDEARATAFDQWRHGLFGPPVCWDLDHPDAFDAAAQVVRPEDVEEAVFVSADPGAHAEHIANLTELGFDEIYLHHVGQTQDQFLEVFGEKVLPQLNVQPKEVRAA
jgi:probable non-F420 flavinoid oxidoreductase